MKMRVSGILISKDKTGRILEREAVLSFVWGTRRKKLKFGKLKSEMGRD